MRLSFEQFRKEPQKALMYAMIFDVEGLEAVLGEPSDITITLHEEI